MFTQQTPLIHTHHSQQQQQPQILPQETFQQSHQQVVPEQQLNPVTIEPSPLTPPASECNSDIENSNPNSQPNQRDKEVQTAAELQIEVKAATYTYDSLMVTDGRSKNKKTAAPVPDESTTNPNSDSEEPPETSKSGRYKCSECGKILELIRF